MQQPDSSITPERHEIFISVNDETLPAVIREDARQPIRGNAYWMCITSEIGAVRLDAPGRYTIVMKVDSVVRGKGGGFILRNLKLERIVI